MLNRRERILALLNREDGLSDREITDRVDGRDAIQQPVNQICRGLAANGVLIRHERADGIIGNYLKKEGKPMVRYFRRIPQKPTIEQNIRKLNLFDKDKEKSKELQKLEQIGFELAGQWILAEGVWDFRLTQYAQKINVLYAFVVDGEVMYIGKTTQTARKRMTLYKNAGESQRTNIRVGDQMINCLQKG